MADLEEKTIILKDRRSLNENFIMAWDDILPNSFCKELMVIGDNAPRFVNRSDKCVKDKQIALDLQSSYVGYVKDLYDHGLIPCLNDYITEHPYLSDMEFVSDQCLLQVNTPPTSGYHDFHGEDVGWAQKSRALTWMVYLNDIEEHGETEFLYQSIRVKPKQGRVVIWPGSWTHLHRGLPPKSLKKYIVTGWWHSQYGMTQIRTYKP